MDMGNIVQNIYNPYKIERKWQSIWRKSKLFSPDLNSASKPFYNLMMFPYPSAEGLHVGNMYAFTGSDIYGRMKRMQGKDVFEPIGLDGFGIHSENYAIKVNRNPKEQAKISQKNFYRQLEATGNAYDWERTLQTYDPDYYKWTHWIFTQLFKAGLAYRKKSPVNFCPSCKTVLADEQVVNRQPETRNQKPETNIGVCERCQTPVEKRELEQWFFKITKYADRLLKGLEKIDWSERVKIAQKNWIGKKEGIEIGYEVAGGPPKARLAKGGRLQVVCWTSRPETNFGATFVVLAPEHPQVLEITKPEHKKEVEKYIKASQNKSNEDRLTEGREKTGAFTGSYALNNLTGEKMPIWVSDFVLVEFGTGAVVGVPGHDRRDFEFAKKFKLPIKQVIAKPPQGWNSIDTSGLNAAYEGGGKIVNSGPWNGWRTPQDLGKVIDWLEAKGMGKRKATYHLRDWLISRQRYWGPPIPMVYCQTCASKGISWFSSNKRAESHHREISNFLFDSKLAQSEQYQISNKSKKIGNSEWNSAGWFPVGKEDLPVLLPDVKDWKPRGGARGPLAHVESFVKVACPKCGAAARRETDVSDTFLDSAWYFLGYLALGHQKSNLRPELRSREVKNQKYNSKVKNELEIINYLPKADHPLEGKLEIPWDREVTRRWLPVDMYIGGAEHSVLHLLYTRFLTMVFKDLGLTRFEEPFTKFRAHGLLVSKGAKMSKSKGNIVNPDDYIEKYGADTLRCYLMFCGRYQQGGDFRDEGIEGMSRFLKRVWRIANIVGRLSGHQEIRLSGNKKPDGPTTRQPESLTIMHQTIKQVTEDIESLDYNTAISALMIWLRALEKKTVDGNENKSVNRELITINELETFLKLLAPFAPFICEELWQRVHSRQFTVNSHKEAVNGQLKTNDWSVHFQPWPKFDSKLAKTEEIQLVIQVNGKVRDTLSAIRGISQNEAEKSALASEKVQAHIGNKKYKTIFVKDKILNFVLK